MKNFRSILATTLALAVTVSANASVSPDQAAKLGTTLTGVGAEMTGNADGTIPAYTGGLKAIPAEYKTGDSFRPDPFANEKPRLVITGQDLAKHKDKLTATSQALLTRYPTYRLDVYPTHRTVALPKSVLETTALNAVGGKTGAGGLALENVLPGVPFPIPSDGYEAMWNHLLRYQGVALSNKYDSWNVDSSGAASLSTTGNFVVEYPLYNSSRPTGPVAPDEVYYRTKFQYTGPARRAGEALLLMDAVDPTKQPRRGWLYLPGQRRVKLAPELAYDTPNPSTAGTATYDDSFLFSGAMDRYDFKLAGKKELYVPYNTYKFSYHKTTADVTTPNHVNPDLLRWELHRVWVVEATLKPGKRHIYSKRTFYLDEDSWIALASDEYDGRGQLYRGGFANLTYSYDVQAPEAINQVLYDLISGAYNLNGFYGPYGGPKYIAPLSKAQWSPESLAGSGIR
ncbi:MULTISPECIES: DUF1329 domain-containing protein [Pseudomonas]|uniref:DUF1329 domain-containing protein n=1 Tax=Pseudomonas petroselini TaxID=2899822 RepID=A0ABS8QRK8_9PSED|nr:MULTISPECIES: DUF1329 domain-containing protein [Pseudomonas]MCD7037678.1 DUF1329 domain-containing protein [Pseudomonas petroselini]MCD7046941.1 DUF1329 domain-containing protein [Pseudomonas petroselini]MCD7066513.1 DUF1329 domain-containing protein [Pseudomonas petroselini]MCM2380440.1 DUF1329 domain-containing protein [Pseudomonas marginalis]MDD2031394.1 DUF1329 domain-containing protein [Pseudomonas sp. 39167]